MSTQTPVADRRWYALTDDGEIVYLGEFDAFHQASDYCDTKVGNAVWIVDHDGVRQWLETLKRIT